MDTRRTWAIAVAVGMGLLGGCDPAVPAGECDAADACTQDVDGGGVECREGEAGCACRAAGSPCGLGLACVGELCVECPEGSGGCACRTTGDACDRGLACEDRRCAECVLGAEGCDCDGGACAEGLVCEADHCRQPSTCEALREAGLCPEGRACTLAAGVPTCLDECELGFRLEDGACVECGEGGCVTTTCADLDCASVHRTCETTDGVPACGGCEAGFREDEALQCVDERLCGGALCPDGEMPMHGAEGTCECVPTPCPTGHARNAAGTCVPCSITCGAVEGETGDLHPLASGATCMCETRDGYFVPPGEDGRARRCDDDGDGWIGATALAAERSPELAISSNARCTIRRAARVDLVNEYGQTLELRPCGDGLLGDPDGLGAARCDDFGGLESIVLVEPDRNDRQAELTAAAGGPTPSAPIYGTGGTFRAAELNALTKACSTEHADYDADGRADVGESQTDPIAALDNDARLDALSFYTELHTATFVPGTGDGALVIAERSRCSFGFPLGYGALDSASEHWRGCHRRRDARFGRPGAPPGLDFAPYSCDAASGTCEVPIPSTGRARTECPAGAAGACHTTAPYHDACEPVAGWGTDWRGMHHHSQFRCVLVDGASSSPYAEPPSAFGPDGHLAFSRCSVDGGFACTPSSTAAGVGWAAVRFTPDVQIRVGALPTDTAPVPEVLGCIDEARASFDGTSWSSVLCPSPTDPAVALEHDFGRIDCPCAASETCDDGADNDCDGLVDCADPDCDALACGLHGLVCGGGVCECTGGSTIETACGDGSDNDCDGLVDCGDDSCDGLACAPGNACQGGACACAPSTELCNGGDDDCDGVVDDGCPTSIIRSTASADTTASATFGGGGGTFFVEGCDHGTVLTGLLGRSSSTTIHRVQPVCSTYSLLTTPGLPESSYRLTTGSPGIAGAAYGGGGGSAFDDACPAGEVVVGIRGRADDEVRRLQLQCGRISVERVGGPWTAVTAPTVLTPARGGTSGTVFTYDCPSGHGVVMITGSAGERVDAIRVFCQRFVADLL